MAKKYLDSDGVLYFWQKIKTVFVTDVSYNSTSKKIQKTKSGSTSDVVTLSTVATSGSYDDLSNKPTIPEGVEKTTTTPKMNGTAAIGSETKFAAGDHVHPTDTSRVPTSRTVNGKALSSNITLSASDVSALPASTSIPSKTSDLTNDSNFVEDASYVHTDNNFTSTEKSKLSGIASGAEVNVQADWNVTSTSSDAYIKNKPTIPTVPTNVSAFTNDAGYISEVTIDSSVVTLYTNLGLISS